jgi:ABC-type sulfate transport system permease component
MLSWIIAVAVLVTLWGFIWRRNLELAFGILLGLPLAWFASRLLTPYLTGMEDIPVWLPPLPLAIIAVLLLVKGALVWIKGNEALPQKTFDEEHEHH